MHTGKFEMFYNRLQKVYKHKSRQAKRLGVSCWRVYDHDLPEFPLCVELYENKIYVAEYKRHHGLSDEEHEAWLEESEKIICRVLSIGEENIYTRLRRRKQGRYAQYEKVNEIKEFFTVQENGLNFLVNLTDYLDTGLFLDHRITRQMVKAQSAGKRVLNLFCYTGAFSVYAAAGNANSVTSVDLSKTYLQWAQDNFAVNNLQERNQYSFIHADVMQYLQALQPGSFDLIIADPPTFSNSKRMKDFFDVQRDYALLLNLALRALAPKGVVYFSTNYTRFILNEEKLHAAHIKDITNITTPFDFEGKLKRCCFLIEK